MRVGKLMAGVGTLALLISTSANASNILMAMTATRASSAPLPMFTDCAPTSVAQLQSIDFSLDVGDIQTVQMDAGSTVTVTPGSQTPPDATVEITATPVGTGGPPPVITINTQPMLTSEPYVTNFQRNVVISSSQASSTVTITISVIEPAMSSRGSHAGDAAAKLASVNVRAATPMARPASGLCYTGGAGTGGGGGFGGGGGGFGGGGGGGLGLGLAGLAGLGGLAAAIASTNNDNGNGAPLTGNP